jgi:hypothetical protein
MILVKEENVEKYEFYKRIVEKQDKLFLQASDNGVKPKENKEMIKKKSNTSQGLYRLPSGRIVPYPAAGSTPV